MSAWRSGRYAVLLISLGIALSGAQAGDEFASAQLQPWEHERFDDITPSNYRPQQTGQGSLLLARCDDSASVYGLRQEIDLRRTPVLHWEWQVDNVYQGIAERTRDGDDFVARVYAVKDGGILKWRTRALNYVWASQAVAGEHWPNPFRDQAMMIALQGGSEKVGEWVGESRNLVEDFQRFFDLELEFIDGIAIMTDCDNHGGKATVRFRNIRVSEQ